MKDRSLLTWFFLIPIVPIVAFLPGCSGSQVVDAETAAEMALDEAGAAATEDGLSDSEKAARKWREEEAARGPAKEAPRKKTGGLVVLPAVEREEAEPDPEVDVLVEGDEGEGEDSVEGLPEDPEAAALQPDEMGDSPIPEEDE